MYGNLRAELGEVLSSALVSLGAGLFIGDILLPLCYRLGSERARPYLMAVVLLPLALMFGVYQLGFWDGADLAWLNALSPTKALALFSLVPLTALAGLGVSFLASCRIMERKEF